MGWLGIILVKGFSFVVPIIAANSLLWVGQGCLRSNLSADKTSLCDRIIHTAAARHMIVYYLSTVNSTESFDLRHPCHTQGRELAEIIGTRNEKNPSPI